MHFATAITECPDVYDRDVYDDITQQFGDMDPKLQHFLGAVASVSPFLTDLMRKEDAWLRERLERSKLINPSKLKKTDNIGAACDLRNVVWPCGPHCVIFQVSGKWNRSAPR